MVRTGKKEFWKQVVDQGAHSLWGLATGFAPLAGARVHPAMFMSAMIIAAFSGWFWTRREREQAADGSHLLWMGAPEWLDPVLDNGIFWASVAGGGCLGYWALF